MDDKEVFNEIKEIIKENGNVKEETRNRLILLALTEIHDKMDKAIDLASQVEANKKQIETLLRHNILLWVKNNKSAAAAIAVSIALLWKVLIPLLHYGLALAGVPENILLLIF